MLFLKGLMGCFQECVAERVDPPFKSGSGPRQENAFQSAVIGVNIVKGLQEKNAVVPVKW
jgi:hypothetical protein